MTNLFEIYKSKKTKIETAFIYIHTSEIYQIYKSNFHHEGNLHNVYLGLDNAFSQTRHKDETCHLNNPHVATSSDFPRLHVTSHVFTWLTFTFTVIEHKSLY